MEEAINYVAYPGMDIAKTGDPTPKMIVQAVSRAYGEIFGREGYGIPELQNTLRWREFIDFRHLCFAFLRTACKMRYADVGRYCMKNHSTVIYGHRNACIQSHVDVRFRQVFDRVVAIMNELGYRIEPPDFIPSPSSEQQGVDPVMFRHDRRIARHGYTIGDLQFSRK